MKNENIKKMLVSRACTVMDPSITHTVFRKCQ